MKKSEVLRKREEFRQLVLEGTKADARVLRCIYVISRADAARPDGERIQVAFKVPPPRRNVANKKYNAVRRNRIKRLMRVGFSSGRMSLDEPLSLSNSHLAVIFAFKGSKDSPADRITLEDVRRDIADLCSIIASKL